MACSIELPFWPSSYDCVKWSKDNRILVQGGENILIFSPRLKEPPANGQWWERSYVIKVNAFVPSEVPRPDVLPDRSLSFGEELSIHQTVAAAWSPPGLARSRSCAVAILTSNHVLSIWAEEGKGGSARWRRVLVINQAIRAYYEQANLEAGDQSGPESVERKQVQQRVRSFAWSHPLYKQSEQSYAHLFTGSQFLLVATEGGALMALRIDSPHQGGLHKHSSWTATIMSALPLREAYSLLTETSGAPSRANAAITRDDLTANSLTIGDWHVRPSESSKGQHCASVALVMGGKLFTTVLFGDAVDMRTYFGKSNLTWHLRRRSDIIGPLEHTTAGGKEYVVAFGEDSVLYSMVKLDLVTTQIELDTQSHHLDGRWDDVTGAAIGTSSTENNASLHIVSHLSSAAAATATLRLPGLQPMAEQPTWQLAIANAKSAYGAEKDLGSNVQERTWGIAACPFSPYVATCATMHTTDIIAYLGHARQTTVLSITHEGQRADQSDEVEEKYSLVGSPDSETVLFWLQMYLQRRTNAVEPDSDLRDRLIRDVLEIAPSASAPNGSGSFDAADAEGLLRQLRLQLYENPDTKRCRAAKLVDIATGGTGLDAQPIQAVVSHIHKTIHGVSSVHIVDDEMSSRILRTYDIAVSMMSTDYQMGYVEPSTKDGDEYCNICHQSIAFESFKWARCGQGHQFSRCRLSLLAIQEPGVNKACGICGLQYFNETALAQTVVGGDREGLPEGEAALPEPANEEWVNNSHGGAATARSTTTLAALLFAACDVCIYCGGKFVD